MMDIHDAFLTELNSEDRLIDEAREAEREDPTAGEDPPEGYFGETGRPVTRWNTSSEKPF
jgi:hypothetical protein